MRTIRALLLAGVAALLVAGAAAAAGHAGRFCPVRRGDKLAARLELSDTQKMQMRDIMAKYRAQLQALRGEKLDDDARRVRVREIRGKMRSEMAAVLTPAQREKLANWRYRREWRCVAPGKGGRRWDGRREWTRQSRVQNVLDRVARELTLTPEQRRKVDALYAQHRDEVRSLVRDAHAPNADRDRIRERAEALKEKVVGEVRPILMPDQQQKLQTLIERWEKRHQG